MPRRRSSLTRRPRTLARPLTKTLHLFLITALLAVLAVVLQPAPPTVQAGPAYQPPTSNVYVIHAGAYIDINTPIGASPGPADDAGSGAANCTLRDALGIVNAGTTSGTVNGCTITTVGAPAGLVYRINLPTGGYTYTLAPANGELLTSANTVYIVGDTAANTIIQASTVDPTPPAPPPGTAAYRVLRNNGAIVEISNVTIRYGRCGSACASVRNSGGGIFNEVGTMTADASTVSANWADHGGGIDNRATLTVQNDSIVSGNRAVYMGGGIWNQATLNVQNGSTIGGAGAGNQAQRGGGIYNLSGTTTVDASTISANTATLSGGGIHNDATLNVRNGSTVSANTANNGGGICNRGTLNVQNGSTVGGAGAGNQANYDGGGIDNAFGGTTTVDGSTVSANRAASRGGGIWNGSTLNVQNGSTIGGAGAGNQANNGGGIYNLANGTVTVDASTVSANTATNGGSIYNAFGTTAVTGSRILNNAATNNGGSVYNDVNTAGATSVTGSCIVGNSATSFLNNQAAQQTATGNWWGAATGPGPVGPGGGDTVSANVDYSGFLGAPILGCPFGPPDLQVNKANDTGGSSTVGMAFDWTLTVINLGGTDATFTTGQRMLKDDLPAGPTYGAPAPGNFTDITNPGNITCTIADNTLSCDAVGADVTTGATTGSFDIVLSVTPNAAGILNNPRSAGNCQVDPDNQVAESSGTNNDCPADNVNVIATVYLPLVWKGFVYLRDLTAR